MTWSKWPLFALPRHISFSGITLLLRDIRTSDLRRSLQFLLEPLAKLSSSFDIERPVKKSVFVIDLN